MAERYHIKSLKYSFGPECQLTAAQILVLKTKLQQTSVQVTIENQPNPFGTLAVFKSKLAYLKDNQLPIGYTFDAGNWYWIGETPEKAFEALSAQITVFHLKDIDHQETVLLGEGTTDWRQLVDGLKKTVPIFLEYAVAPDELAGQIQLVNQAQ